MRNIDLTTLIFGSIIALLVGTIAAGLYDASAERNCQISYDTSFNGLYVLKMERCEGRLGWTHDAKVIDKKLLIEAF